MESAHTYNGESGIRVLRRGTGSCQIRRLIPRAADVEVHAP